MPLLGPTDALTRLTRRTVLRRRRRQELWNGNVEAPLRSVFTDPDHILRWGWSNRRVIAGTLVSGDLLL